VVAIQSIHRPPSRPGINGQQKAPFHLKATSRGDNKNPVVAADLKASLANR
jgi:hypothetical protein